jgi:hypothetical protein
MNSDFAVEEVPDTGMTMKNWSPRRFEYGGRRFVWEAEKDGGLFQSFQWETLHEIARVWKKDGSKTGKMEDETMEPRLAWGEKGGEKGAEHTLYFAAGLDQHFREHLLASQLARFVRTSQPPYKDVQGLEAVDVVRAGMGLWGLVNVVRLLSG